MKTSKKFILTFAGDTSLGEWYLLKPGKKELRERLEKNPFSFFQGVKSLVENSDCLILNIETVIYDNPYNSLEGKKYPNYDHPARIIDVLRKLGVTTASLANNHTMDFGREVMLYTKSKLEAAGIEAFGAGKDISEASRPYKLKLKGECSTKNVYVFAAMSAARRYRVGYNFFANKENPGVNQLSQSRMYKEISNLREKDPGAIIIVCPHWQGFDYKWVSENLKVQEKCRSFIEAGADYLFGHGPHMVNHIEKYQNGTIAYSIGNFVFNSPGRYKEFKVPPFSLVVKLVIMESNGVWTISPYFYPTVTDNKSTGYTVVPVNYEQAIELNRILNDRANEIDMDVSNGIGNNETGFFLTVESKNTHH